MYLNLIDWHRHCSYCNIPNECYLIIGANSSEQTNEVFRIKIKENFPFNESMTWDRCGNLAIYNNDMTLSSFTVYDGKIYLIFSQHLQIFDPKTNKTQVLGPSNPFYNLFGYNNTLIGLSYNSVVYSYIADGSWKVNQLITLHQF